MVKAKVWTYYVESEKEFETVDEAMRFACTACVENTCFVESITDGDKTYQRSDLLAYWDEHALW